MTALSALQKDLAALWKEVCEECTPKLPSVSEPWNVKKFIHWPYFPAFHHPGWMTRYIFGPFDDVWLESLVSDFWAGVTVSLTLIPQGLSYAILANVPPIYGLYTAILPTATYAFFGSSMQLTVGPTALISLLTGTLVNKYQPDWAENPMGAVDTAAQAAFCCGIIISLMGILNLGHLINFMSHPVMSGFTTGAALIIGMSQLKGAFGMTIDPPQVGSQVEHNYEIGHWWMEHFHGTDDDGHLYRNHYAIKICFGLYVPLMIVQMLKWYIKPIPANKLYRLWSLFVAFLPFIAIVIGAHVAYLIKKNDHFNDPDVPHAFYASKLKIVGEIPSGLNILRIPQFRHPMGEFFVDIIPLTLIAFMESYSIARNIASSNNQLHLLNASQEMWANGVANLAGCVSSAYPVSGSFSRSALNQSCGAKTPLAKCITMIIVIVCLTTLTSTFQYIPAAALSAVIFVAIANLISITDLWHAWKYSKKDFFTMIVTITFVFVFETSVGLAVGILTSVIVYLVFDIIFAKSHAPRLFQTIKSDGRTVEVVRLESDLNFLTAARVKDFLTSLALLAPEPPAVTNRSEYIRFQIANAFDALLKPDLLAGVDTLPRAVVIDMCIVKTVDISGMQALEEAMKELRTKKVLVALINVNPSILDLLHRFGVHSDVSTTEVNFDEYAHRYRLDLWSKYDVFSVGAKKHTINDEGNDMESGHGNTSFHEIELMTVRDAASNDHNYRNL